MPDSPPELATLRDIHLPEPVSWWPLAPGWYAVAVLSIIIIGFIFHAVHRHYQNTYAKRQALRLLAEYKVQYLQSRESNVICARISELLKRVALAYFPRDRVAALQGKEWIQFLNETGSGIEFQKIAYELLELPYQSKVTRHNLDALFTITQRWIKQRKKPCLN